MAEIQENPILAFFSNLFRGIKLPSPEKDAATAPADVAYEVEPTETKPAATDDESINPPVVNFPKQDFDSVKLGAESVEAEPNTNPLLLWQVYAVGGFFILRWAWTRWNERKGRKKLDDEPPPDSDEH